MDRSGSVGGKDKPCTGHHHGRSAAVRRGSVTGCDTAPSTSCRGGGVCRGGGIRTPGLLLPKQVRYRTALLPGAFRLGNLDNLTRIGIRCTPSGSSLPSATVGWADERSSYQPALDGVRGLAVAFVVGFHLGLPWAAGGYLGVSVFFTLSGFLITWLLLQEHERTGRIDIRAFYLRRARRLLPAALVCIAAVTALLAAGVLQERTGARVEVYSATFEVANWQALLSGHSYADLFAAPSALAHFWSLAIEEQFYVVWPVALASLLAWAARRRGRASLRTALTGMFVVFAVSAAVTAHWWSADAAYYASWARFGEILAGAALASLLARRSLPTRAGLLAPVCLAAIVVLCIATPSGTGWPYAGGLPLFALLSAGLIAGLQVDGPVRRLLAWRPLVWLGVISYGVYLFHWPVIVVLDEQRTGLDGLPLIALRLAVTLVLAGSVYAVVERPVRARLVLARPSWFLSSAATAIAAVVVAVVLVVPELGVRHIGDRVTLLAAPRTAVAPVKPAEPAASTNAASSGAAVNPPTAAAPKGDPEAVKHASARSRRRGARRSRRRRARRRSPYLVIRSPTGCCAMPRRRTRAPTSS